MPQFGKASQERLATCHPVIVKVMNEAIIHGPDFSIICGYRSPAEQQELFKQGRDANGNIIDPLKVVTHVDGVTKLSKHNQNPSMAVDIVPYPSMYGDRARCVLLGAYIMGIAHGLAAPLTWGADWDSDWDLKEHPFVDLPHFQLEEAA